MVRSVMVQLLPPSAGETRLLLAARALRAAAMGSSASSCRPICCCSGWIRCIWACSPRPRCSARPAHLGVGFTARGATRARCCAAALLMALTGLGFAGSTTSGRCSSSPSSARSILPPAMSASSCRWSRRCSHAASPPRIGPRCSPATALSARSWVPAGTLLAALPELAAAGASLRCGAQGHVRPLRAAAG